MSVYVIVDDTDPDLQYSPLVSRGYDTNASACEEEGWCVGSGGGSPEFLVTTSASGKSHSIMTYELSGSSISVFGTIGPLSDTNTTVSFSIDNTVLSTASILSEQTVFHHVPLFTSSSLSSPTRHNISMEILSPNTATSVSNVFLDYLVYEATASSSIPNGTVQTSWVFVDDSSPYLEYDGGWDDSVPNPEDLNVTDAIFNSTISGPFSSSSTVSLNFTGASTVRVFAMLVAGTASGSLGTYLVDSESSSSPLNIPSSGSSFPIPNFEILTAKPLDRSIPHRIEITADSTDAFYLDYILLDSQSAFVTAPDSGGSASSSTATVPASGATQTAGLETKTHLGSLVGGVVGGIGALVLLGILLFYLWRRRYSQTGTAGRRFESVGYDRGDPSSGVIDIVPAPSPESSTDNDTHSGHPAVPVQSQSRVLTSKHRGTHHRPQPGPTTHSISQPRVRPVSSPSLIATAGASGSGRVREGLERDSGRKRLRQDGPGTSAGVPPPYGSD